jgi:hypothetical protein
VHVAGFRGTFIGREDFYISRLAFFGLGKSRWKYQLGRRGKGSTDLQKAPVPRYANGPTTMNILRLSGPSANSICLSTGGLLNGTAITSFKYPFAALAAPIHLFYLWEIGIKSLHTRYQG